MDKHSELQYHYKNIGQDIICGADTISGINDTLDEMHLNRALIVCGPTILSKSDVVQRVEGSLGDKYVGIFSGVTPHSPINTVEEGVQVLSLIHI